MYKSISDIVGGAIFHAQSTSGLTRTHITILRYGLAVTNCVVFYKQNCLFIYL